MDKRSHNWLRLFHLDDRDGNGDQRYSGSNKLIQMNCFFEKIIFQIAVDVDHVFSCYGVEFIMYFVTYDIVGWIL